MATQRLELVCVEFEKDPAAAEGDRLVENLARFYAGDAAAAAHDLHDFGGIAKDERFEIGVLARSSLWKRQCQLPAGRRTNDI